MNIMDLFQESRFLSSKHRGKCAAIAVPSRVWDCTRRTDQLVFAIAHHKHRQTILILNEYYMDIISILSRYNMLISGKSISFQ